MGTSKKFINHYRNGYMPWTHEEVDFNFADMVRDWPINPCRALELGCGTGTDAIWFAQNGFDVTAVDVSDIAIGIARENANKHNVECNFIVADFWKDGLDQGNFDLVFDRGYFHSYKTGKKRHKMAKLVTGQLNAGGLWLSLIGSCDSPPRTGGPPMHSAKEIISGVEPFFEILVMKSSRFGSEKENPAKNWVVLMKKR